MSVEIMTAVFKHSQARYGDRIVLLAIADCANDDDRSAWPSKRKIAAKCLMSERQVQRAIGNLEKLGELKVVHSAGPGGSNLFTILTGGDNMSGGDTHVSGGETSTAQRGDTHVSQIIREPSKNHQDSFALSASPPRAVGKEKAAPAGVDFNEIVRELTLQYPGVNVEAQIPAMNRWLARNPSRRMTKRFMQRWLDKCDVEIETGGRAYQARESKSGSWNGEDLQHRKYSEFDYVSREGYEEHCRAKGWKPIYE